MVRAGGVPDAADERVTGTRSRCHLREVATFIIGADVSVNAQISLGLYSASASGETRPIQLHAEGVPVKSRRQSGCNVGSISRRTG
jgi:hypothetical protein